MLLGPLRATDVAPTLAAVLEWHIGDVVRKLREQRRWNQTKLARAAKLNKATVVRIEEGGNSKRETLEAVARALGMSLGVLYGELPSGTRLGDLTAAETELIELYRTVSTEDLTVVHSTVKQLAKQGAAAKEQQDVRTRTPRERGEKLPH